MPHQLSNQLSIISTAYNEEENIKFFFDECERIRQFAGETLPLILVNNGSKDHTLQRMKGQLSRVDNVRIINNPSGNGYGSGIQAALKNMSTQYALIFPTDLQYSTFDAKRVIDKFLMLSSVEKSHICILTYRYNRKDSIYNRIRGWLWRHIVCILLKLPHYLDPASQLRLICRDCSLNISEESFLWDIIQTKQSNEKISPTNVISVTLHPRIRGVSSLKRFMFRDEFFAFKKLLDIRHDMN